MHEGETLLRLRRARRPAAARCPGLVLIPDVRGLSDHYRDVARRFAAEGFFTLAVDLYSREGAPELPDMAAVFRWIRALPDPRVLADLGGGGGVLGGRPEVAGRARSASPASASAGSTRSWRRAPCPASRPRVSWYGMLRYAERNAREAREPARSRAAARLSLPRAVRRGGRAHPARRRRGAARHPRRATGKDVRDRDYPGAGHAFFNDTRPDAYRPAAAADAWPRAVAFLRARLAR